MTRTTLWTTFLKGLSLLDPTFNNCLNPKSRELQERMATLTQPYPIPKGYIELYEQGNGEKAQCSSGIFFGMRFLSLDEAQSLRTQWAAEAPDEDDEFLLPREYHLPVFSDMTGNELCVDLSCRGQVVIVGADYDEPQVLAEDLSELMEWAVWMTDQRGYLHIEQIPQMRAALSFSNHTVVPNAILEWQRSRQRHLR